MVPSRHLLCVSPMCPVMSHVSSSSLPVLAFLFSVTSPLLFRSLRNFRARHDSDGDDSNRKPSDINGAVVFRENRLKECPFMLSDDQIQQFLDDGVIVVPVLSEDEVQRSRIGFHKDLKRLGCDPENLSSTASALSGISSTGGAGGILDIFYSEWKLSVNEHPHVVAAFVQLFRATYASWRDDNSSLWYHPFGQFQAENVFMYIDRCCFRVPDAVSRLWRGKKKKTLQRSLTPHLDCCPQRLFLSDKAHPKWRPIQGFVALTDTINANEGGFEAAIGLHKKFAEWTRNRPPSISKDKDGRNVVLDPPCVGDFTPIRPLEDKEVLEMMRHIPVRAGDLVLWDYRIAHANSRINIKNSAREVVYVGVLPGVKMNEEYAVHQLTRYQQGIVPDDQWHEHNGVQACNHEFSSLGRKMMTIDNH